MPLLLAFHSAHLSPSHSFLLLRGGLLPEDLLRLSKSTLFLATHLSRRLPESLLLPLWSRLWLSKRALLALRLPKDLLRLSKDALLLRLRPHLRLSKDSLLLRLRPHLRLTEHTLLLLSHLRLRPHLRLLSYLRLRSHLRLPATTSRRRTTTLLLRRRASTGLVAAATATAAFTFALAKNVLIQAADQQKAKRHNGNKFS